MLTLCKEKGIHTAIETAANVPFNLFEGILPVLDLAIIDIKCITEETHRKHVGASNKLILENITRILSEKKCSVWIRVPIIPKFNLNRTELEKTAEYISGLEGVSRVELMKYHALGESKKKSLGFSSENNISIADDEFAEAVMTFRKKGVHVAN